MHLSQIISDSTREWLRVNGPILILGILVFIQWIALQGFLVHYHFFRKNLKQPKPDALRMNLLERAFAAQAEEFQSVFLKIADLRKEIKSLSVSQERPERNRAREDRQLAASTSIEASYASMGEMMLKKRLQEMQQIESKITH